MTEARRREAAAPGKAGRAGAKVIPIRPLAAVGKGAPSGISAQGPGDADSRQRRRRLFQAGFFALFILAPILNLFRFDLTLGHAFILGLPWRLGLDDFLAGRIGGVQAGVNLFIRLFLPILAGAGLFILAAWRWGRLYCGWLCPHFSVVETVNSLMRRAIGRQSVWDRRPLPLKDGALRQADGGWLRPDARWWLVTVPAAVGFAFLWAVVLLTYLLPPAQVYGDLARFSPTRNEALFLSAGTVVLSIEFLFARHLFCRFACAVGLFQSLAWMGNRSAMVVGFDRARAADCTDCREQGGNGYYACEQVCPMHLKPRSVKQAMFTCTQCAQCISACAVVEGDRPGLLSWVEGEAARQNEATMSLTGRRG